MCFMFPSGRGLPIRDVLGKSKMILGLLEGIPTMHKAEIAMVTLETFVKIRSCPCKLCLLWPQRYLCPFTWIVVCLLYRI